MYWIFTFAYFDYFYMNFAYKGEEKQYVRIKIICFNTFSMTKQVKLKCLYDMNLRKKILKFVYFWHIITLLYQTVCTQRFDWLDTVRDSWLYTPKQNAFRFFILPLEMLGVFLTTYKNIQSVKRREFKRNVCCSSVCKSDM